jgi:hypothetical protein
MSSIISIKAADILDEVIQKDPTISSNTGRLEAANEYINRIRLVVEEVESVIRKSIASLTDPAMCALRDKFAKSVTVNQNVDIAQEILTVESLLPKPLTTEERLNNIDRACSISKVPRSINEIEKERASDDKIFYSYVGSVEQGLHTSHKSIPTKSGCRKTIEHLGSEIDTKVLFDGAQRELRQAFADIESRFLQDVIESITKDLKDAKIDVISSMFSERSTVM